jgi:hypothetical protein
MSSAYSVNSDTVDSGMSYLYRLYVYGDDNDPWGTPVNMSLHSENAQPIFTLITELEKSLLLQ